ncbi:MAG TPA: hypothetical protein VFI00_19780 [Kribbella sp.]|nr:hypothetical protein [Kribbella sp.]
MMQSQYVMTEIARQRQDAFVRQAENRRRSRTATPAQTSGDTVARRSWFVWRRFAQAAR